ncbi:MAG: 4Fe-4S dicluster domain-containing protein [Candidatus Binatia bacterium]|jgi:heterodisulfide reductase subunit C/nitrate reductase gamma subunit
MTSFFIPWGLIASLAIAATGIAYRVVIWLSRSVDDRATCPPASVRVAALVTGTFGSLFGPRMPRMLAAFGLDVLVQRKLWQRDRLRWLAHMAIFVGFGGLFLVHALHGVVTEKLWPGYCSTVNPWLWLRDLLGLLAVAGLALTEVRRRFSRSLLPAPKPRDLVFVALVAAILATGFLLTAAKIISAPDFERMVATYSNLSAEEQQPLKVYWQTEYGMVFPASAPDAALLKTGEEVHESACASCHSRPQSAFVSYPLSRLLRAVAVPLAAANASVVLFNLHVLLCLLGIAYLPFGRALHIFAAPTSLVAAAGAATPATVNAVARRSLALDACVRCGLCDERCSVAALWALFDNPLVLPASKLDGVRRLSAEKLIDANELATLAQGAYACTECGRCTRDCPVGLDLDDLWTALKARLASCGQPTPAARVKTASASQWADRLAASSGTNGAVARAGRLTDAPRIFSHCVQCQTCTNVCPVVAESFGPGGVDATPQRVMNLLRLGMTELALGSRMVWNCTTCYQCQEHCPAGIRVTDVLYDLRNQAYAQMSALAAIDSPAKGDAL